MSQSPANSESKLSISPTYLEFGRYNPQDDQTEQPSITINITNIGGGMLIGRVIPQVNWITISPVEFRCGENQSSQHTVKLDAGLPQRWNRRYYSFDSLIVVNSNKDAQSIGGEYMLSNPTATRLFLPARNLVIRPVAFIVFLSILFFTAFIIKRNVIGNGQSSKNTLYTQGAQTVFAQMTLSASPDVKKINTPTSALTVVSNAIPTTSPTPTPDYTLEPTPTFTPWPREQYQNPEQFIRDYYTLVDEREYNKAWNLLSDGFQDNCCNLYGSDPFNTYVNWWNSVESVEVLSAYIQEWDANPIPVVVTLRYHHESDYTTEDSHVFYLIADEVLNTLLIDEVK